MSRFLFGVAFLLASLAAPATASEPVHIFHTTAPCAAACPAWTSLSDASQAMCEKQPLAPPGTWDDWRLTIPEGARTVALEIRPVIDYDLYLCLVVNPGPSERYVSVPNGDHVTPGPCYIGCVEEMTVCVYALDDACLKPGDEIVWRAWNFSDLYDCPAY